MSGRRSYDQELRVIGQSLEAKRINVFELKLNGESYIVHGDPERAPSLIARLRELGGRMRRRSAASSLSYLSSDFELLERTGRSQRRQSNRLPDFYGVSNTLRTLGSYLDQKGAELLEIHKRPLSVTLLYQNQNGHPNVEERSIASFYSLFIDLYGKRGHRT
jgi:hypothetical protein